MLILSKSIAAIVFSTDFFVSTRRENQKASLLRYNHIRCWLNQIDTLSEPPLYLMVSSCRLSCWSGTESLTKSFLQKDMKFHMSSLKSSTIFLDCALFPCPLEKDEFCFPVRMYGLPSSMTYLGKPKKRCSVLFGYTITLGSRCLNNRAFLNVIWKMTYFSLRAEIHWVCWICWCGGCTYFVFAMASSRKNWSTGKVRPKMWEIMNEKKGQFSNKQFAQYIMPGLEKK